MDAVVSASSGREMSALETRPDVDLRGNGSHGRALAAAAAADVAATAGRGSMLEETNMNRSRSPQRFAETVWAYRPRSRLAPRAPPPI